MQGLPGSENARSEQLLMMPTEQLTNLSMRMAARRALEWIRMFKGLVCFNGQLRIYKC